LILIKCNNGEFASTFKFWLKLDSHRHCLGRLRAFLVSELSLAKYLSQQKMFPENVLKNETHLIPNTGLPSV
jgi:hypothetical protein